MPTEDHAGMRRGRELAAKLREKGINTVAELQHALETADRGADVWIWVASDDGDPVNAAGFYPDEHAAFLAGEEYRREWASTMDDEPPDVRAIPLFFDRRQVDG